MDSNEQKRQLIPILIFFALFLVLGIFLISFYGVSLKSVSTSMLWMLACIMAGGAIGFLFGIPKTFQGNKLNSGPDNEETKDYRLQVNTNLTEISDWLTKIIVGLGLVNLTKIPPYINSIALSLANGINATDKGSALAFAYGLITCYTILGFLFGYLFTRLVLSKAFSVADQESIVQIQSKLVSTQIQIADIESKQGLITQSLYPENESLKTAQPNEQPLPNLQEKLSRIIELANSYLQINVADRAERTRLKDEVANNMGSYALTQKIPKSEIYQNLQTNPNEGMVLALATLINIRPESGDLEMILQAGQKLSRLHVRYRVLLAIVALHKKGYVKNQDKERVIALVNTYRNKADQPLLDLVDSTLSLLNN